MHELAVTESIIKIASDAARRNGAPRIRAIHIVMGPFGGIVPECVQMYLDVLGKGTPVEGARLIARTLPLKVRCLDCGAESEITRRHIACPACGSLHLKRLSGTEFYVEKLEADDPE